MLHRVCAASITVLAALAGAYGMETDQILALGVEVTDSADVLNRYVDFTIDERLARLNSKRGPKRRSRLECSDVALHVLGGFRRPFYSKVARWAHNDPQVDRYPESTVKGQNYYRQSVLGSPYYSHLQIPLGRTVNVSGVYFGADKLGHFLSFGARYYKRWIKATKKGLSEEEATRRVILWGLKLEKTLVGGITTGVVSFGDLEANYQGLLFARSLCDPEASAHLELDADDRWTLVGTPEVRDYVNPGWDEAYNPSAYAKRRWKNIRKRIARQCDKLHDPGVLERFEFYDSVYSPSYNESLMREMESRGAFPPRSQFSVVNVCDDGP